jgi:hypothetical protein
LIENLIYDKGDLHVSQKLPNLKAWDIGGGDFNIIGKPVIHYFRQGTF